MNDLTQFCKSLKIDFTPKISNPTKPVKYWSEKDIFNGKIIDALVIIFRTQGCSWAFKSGCSMCGYFNDSMWKKVSNDDLLKQFNSAMEKYNNEKFVKIFTSGSFLDDSEIKPKLRNKILSKLFETTEKVSVESRPEFATNDKLSVIKDTIRSKTFEVGIGLETANDFIRKNAINKGFTFKDYKKAANTLKKNDFRLKTYILIKPPYLTEKESIQDCIKTVESIKKYTDIISFNPTNVQRNTFVEYLWKQRKYRPPWLFSIIEILKESKKIAGNITLKCDIAGGGSIRGAHNCKSCDHQFLNAISEFSLFQKINIFKDLNCDCREKWFDQLDIEDIGFGSLVNI
jgi:radical SAM enzyme (TIGR01210 family)